MNVNEKKIVELLLNNKKVVWKLEELFEMLSKELGCSVGDLKNRYYLDVYLLIKYLEESSILKSRGKLKTVTSPSLYLQYKVLKEKKEFTEEEKINIIRLNHIDCSYYKNRVDEFRDDYSILVVINDILRNAENHKDLSLNELSYMYFGYEKYLLKGKEGKLDGPGYKIISKLGIQTSDLGCRNKSEPLLNTIFKGFYAKDIRNILIVENLDTYWSLNRIYRENYSNIDMLIWGRGYDITKNFSGIILYGVSEKDNILYYGDIDLEGVNIYSKLINNYKEYNIEPYTKLYANLLNIGKINGIKPSVSQNHRELTDEDMNYFLGYFDDEIGNALKDVLLNRDYVPQEALNYLKLKELL